MKIKNLKLKNRIFLAPMEEINDIAFRLLCKKAGAGLTYTPLTHPQSKQNLLGAISPEAFGNRRSVIRGSSKETSGRLLDDKPALQLFCTTTKGVKEFIKKHDKKVSLWDFNLGCPATTAKKHGFGSYLKDLKKIKLILKTMRQATKKPLTCKIRKSDIAFQILEIAEKYCDAITVHPRTQSQGYSGKPDIKFAEQIKSKSKIPVIYSGDISENNYKQLLKKFDFIMIGRRAIGDPNIFAKLTSTKLKKQITFRDYLRLAEKYNLYFRQIKLQAMNFTKRKKHAKKLRLKIYKAKTLEEIKRIYDEKQ